MARGGSSRRKRSVRNCAVWKFINMWDKETTVWQKVEEGEKALAEKKEEGSRGGGRKRRKRFDWGRLSSVFLLCATWPCCLHLCFCYVCFCIMAAHIPRQQWNTCSRVLCALLRYKYKTKTMNKNKQQNHICNQTPATSWFTPSSLLYIWHMI